VREKGTKLGEGKGTKLGEGDSWVSLLHANVIRANVGLCKCQSTKKS